MKPPGIKRLLVVCSAIAYVILGVPIWWATTSLHRPPLPHNQIAAASSESNSRSALLPVALRVVLVAPAGQQLPDALSATALLHALQAAVQNRAASEAQPLLSTTVAAASQCTHATAPGIQQQQIRSCPNLSAAPVGASSRQLDAWLEKQLAAAAAASATGSAHAAAAPGQYTLLLLPNDGGGSSSSSNENSGTVTVGRNRHAWMLYDPVQSVQQPTQLSAAAAAAAVRSLSCCFALHNSKAALTGAANLPISAAGHTQLSFSLLNADVSGDSRHLSWDFGYFEEKYLAHITASLAPVCQTSAESQVLYFTPARQQGKWSKKHNAFVVKQSQLQFFIDSEWAVESGRAVMQVPAGSSSSSGRTAAAAAAEIDQSAVLEPHVLHFLVYIPAKKHSPLLLLGPKGRRRDSNSFWIPSWGGLVVVNKWNETGTEQHTAASSASSSSSSGSNSSRDQNIHADGGGEGVQAGESAGTAGATDGSRTGSSCDDASSSSSASCIEQPDWSPVLLKEPDYQQIAAVVIAQMQALFGVAPDSDHSSSSSSSSEEFANIRLQQLPAGAAGFTQWQVDALVRQRAGADLLEAARVLASLSKLVLELPNLEMPDLIGQQVAQALADIKLAWQHIAAADYHAASAAAAAARAAAEAAFLHPSVLAQLNFPESHKLGVYMPLFLPVSVPLLQGLVSQVLHYVRRWRVYRAVQLGRRPT